MVGVPSVIQYETRGGGVAGIEYQDTDIDMIRHTARWWCVSYDHYYRMRTNRDHWLGYYTDPELDPEQVKEHEARVGRIAHRVSKLARITEQTPLARGRVHDSQTALWATLAGGRLVEAPWTKYPKVVPSRAAHAWAASDIGMELQSQGLTVYSEREFSLGMDVHGREVVGGKFINSKPGTKALNDHGPRPDLAIAGRGGDKFILVEVERSIAKGYAHFENKLYSYFANPRVGAVWYVVEHGETARRLQKLVTEITTSREMRDVPFRFFRLSYGARGNYAYSPGYFSAQACRDDLDMIGAYDLG